jgi:hypothetical protein
MPQRVPHSRQGEIALVVELTGQATPNSGICIGGRTAALDGGGHGRFLGPGRLVALIERNSSTSCWV